MDSGSTLAVIRSLLPNAQRPGSKYSSKSDFIFKGNCRMVAKLCSLAVGFLVVCVAAQSVDAQSVSYGSSGMYGLSGGSCCQSGMGSYSNSQFFPYSNPGPLSDGGCGMSRCRLFGWGMSATYGSSCGIGGCYSPLYSGYGGYGGYGSYVGTGQYGRQGYGGIGGCCRRPVCGGVSAGCCGYQSNTCASCGQSGWSGGMTGSYYQPPVNMSCAPSCCSPMPNCCSAPAMNATTMPSQPTSIAPTPDPKASTPTAPTPADPTAPVAPNPGT